MIELALKMDIDGDDNIMQTKNAYFNATHSRVHGFKSFGLWVYHPSMHHILRLASMEIRSENSQDIAQFFKLFNELVAKVSKSEGKMFNPRFFMCDEGGANHKAIRIVYGDEFAKTRVVGCQWHFKNDASRIAKRIGPDMREMFTTLTKELCKVTTVAKYKILKSRQDKVAKLYPEIVNWINWWHERRSHIFVPFRGGGLPGVNLSEQGNAGWKRRPMSLVRAAKEDFATMVLQERRMHMFHNNLQASDGHGPSQADREAKFRGQQEREAEEFVNILDDDYAIILEAVQSENPEYHLPKAVEKHRPKRKQKNDASKESKKKLK